MKLHEFRKRIDKLDNYYQKVKFVEIQGEKFPIVKGDPEVCISVFPEKSYIGPRPSVPVYWVQEGVDWEHGNIYLIAEKDLQVVDSNSKITMKEKEDRCDKCVYTNQCLMSGTLYPDHPCEKYKRDPPDGGYYG